MTLEPIHDEITGDESEPATKGELRSLRREVADLRTDVDGIDQRLIRVERDVTELKTDMNTVKDTTARMLQLLEQIDGNTNGLPERVSKLEEDVTELMLQR